MGQREGRMAVRRLFGGCLLVLFDIAIQGFDILIDPVGYLIIASAAASLAPVDRAFRVVQNSSYILALFSFAGVIRSMRASTVMSSPTFNDSGSWSWSRPSSASVPLEEAVSPSALLGIIGAAVEWCLVWFLLTGVARLAHRDGLAVLAQRSTTARNGLLATFVVAEVFVWALLASDRVDQFEGVIIAVGIANIVLGLLGLKVIWDAGGDLLFLQPTDSAQPVTPSRAVAWLGLLAAAAGVIAIGVAANETPFDPRSPVNLATERQAPGRAEPAYLEADVSEPERYDDYGNVVFGGTLDDENTCRSLSGLTAIDLVRGEARWSQEVPRQVAERLMTLDGKVLILDDRVGNLLPSLAAVDVVSGELDWQHYFDAPNARIYGHGPDSAAVSVGDFESGEGGDVLVLDVDGNEVQQFRDDLYRNGDTPNDLEPGFNVWPVFSTWVWHHHWWDLTAGNKLEILASPPGPDGQQALVDWRWDRRMGVYRPSTGEVVMLEPLGPSGLYNQPGNPHSPGEALQNNVHLTMFLLGSDQGPNSKVVVHDAQSGEPLWEKEHVRSAALADGLVLFDKRNDAVANELVTRTLYLVDGNDPDEVIWSTELSVNAAGGNGYLGPVGVGDNRKLVFLVEGEDGADNFLMLPMTKAEATDVPEVLRAGGRLGGGPTTLSHADDNVLVAASGSEIVWRRAGRSTQRVNLWDLEPGATQVRSLVVVGDTLVVEHNGTWRCGSVDRVYLDELVNGPGEAQFNLPSDGERHECDPPPTTLSAVDATNGQLLWSNPIPVQPGGLQRFGDGTVLIADTQAGRAGPSLSLVDADTGYVRWQRFFDGFGLSLLGVDPLTDDPTAVVAVQPESSFGPYTSGTDGLGVVVDIEGGLVHDFAVDSGSWPPDSVGALHGYHNLSTVPYGARIASPNQSARQAIANVDGPIVVVDDETQTLTLPRDVVYDDGWRRLGNDASVGEAIQVGADYVMVLLASDVGPNSKLKVFDADTGEMIWEADHLRSAAAAGRYILYDKRNENPADAAFTRDLYLVDPHDPDKAIWTARLAVNDEGGNGFIGLVDWSGSGQDAVTGLVFLTRAGEQPLDFRVVDPSGTAPLLTDLFAGGTVGGGESARSYVSSEPGGEIMVAADGNTIIWQRPETTTQRLPLDSPDPIAALTVTGGVILVEQRQAITFC